MQQLRRYRWIALALALWMSATVSAAALSPLFRGKADASDFIVLCTSAGMKLVSLDADGHVKTSSSGNNMHSALDCPGCLTHLTTALPPVAFATLAIDFGFSIPDFLAPSFASREALMPAARGPPTSL
jgi:hypothetical protein